MPEPRQGRAVVIGAGPAGLTAAWELLDRTGIVPIVFEATGDVGGLSRTVEYKGNRIDIGGHRFFSRSDRVMRWWLNILPLQGAPARDDRLLGRGVPLQRDVEQRLPGASAAVRVPAPDPERQDAVMLRRRRVSRIYFARRLFNYPVTLDARTLRDLGARRVLKIGASYVAARLRPARAERSLEDFFVNRFGWELYRTFFRDYTEKVWGLPCSRIRPEWGAQRVKGLSVAGVIGHALRRPFRRRSPLGQKGVETSLIEQFLYPKLGPGQMWQEVARQVRAHGGEIHLAHSVLGVALRDGRVAEVAVRDETTGAVRTHAADWVFSTMAVKDLIAAMGDAPPAPVREVARGLAHRDFITVGLLLRRLKLRNETAAPTVNGLVPDNWIYIQESDVKVGRLQIFNNWSPYLVKDPETVWVGLEYFCSAGDALWGMADEELARFAVAELARLDIVDAADVLDHTVIRVPKTYPVYVGTYDRFPEIREWVDGIENLFLIGRNGMHRYNNQDHSMLTAMRAVDCIAGDGTRKSEIWDVNAEPSYHEAR